jgi:hypothetical protein
MSSTFVVDFLEQFCKDDEFLNHAIRGDEAMVERSEQLMHTHS